MLSTYTLCVGQTSKIHLRKVVHGQVVHDLKVDPATTGADALLRVIGGDPVILFARDDVWKPIEAWCEDEGYNAPTNPILDIRQIASFVWPTQQFDTWNQLLTYLNMLDEPDVFDQMEPVLRKIEAILADWPIMLLQQVTELSASIDSGFHRLASDALESVTSLSRYEIPAGRQVIHQLLFRELEIPERIDLEEEEFHADEIVRWFAPDGSMKEVFPEYEPRQGQLDMLAEVATALAEGRHAIVEAGTGTGKSLGYLVPAAYFSLMTGERVVVATHTLHLQTQLMERDVPIVQNLLAKPIVFAILKGRTNYVCMRKVASQVNSAGLVSVKEERAFLIKTLVWLKDTVAGERDELPLLGREAEHWESIQSETETCINKRCPWFKYCYYHRAKAIAQQANIVITNHSLVLTDLKADHSVLPGYSYLILDEAHQLEDGATKHLGLEVHNFVVFGILNRLAKDRKTGMIPSLKQRVLVEYREQPERAGAFAVRLDQMLDTLVNIRLALEECFQLLSDFVKANQQLTEEAKWVVRVLDEHRNQETWQPVLNAFANFHSHMLDLRRHVKKWETEMEEITNETLLGQIQDVIGVIKELDRIWEQLNLFMQSDDPHYVAWLEREERVSHPYVGVYRAPIDVGPLLDEQLFSKKQSVILTSATLTVNRSFEYVIQRLGLRHYTKTGELSTLIVESPFRYRDQALLCIPSDMPAMVGEGSEGFLVALCDTLVKLARVSKGRMLVLFTSYRMLKDVYERTLHTFQEFDLHLLAQGVSHSNRHRLIQDFKQHKHAVLFGTNSLWEGVDIPGEQLSTLVIVRLPFWPPNHPVIEARMEDIKQKGRNAFREYAVPQAIVRFKQGFGRLVRSTRDVGAVIVLDRRIVDASYGKIFLQSLPDPRIFQGTRREIYAAVYHWLKDPEQATR
jgi:ATP-dependent DNA helicase DinG